VLVLVGLPVAATFAFDKGWLRVPRPLAPGEWPVKTSADDDLALVRQLIATLLDHHVAIVVTDAVPTGAAAAWNSMAAEISIRPSVIGQGLPVLAEVLAHEAAHVAQSCSAGGLPRASCQVSTQAILLAKPSNWRPSALAPGRPGQRS
jgi:hypothetical protein